MLTQHIIALSELCCYNCRESWLRIHVYADWSVFSLGLCPVPLVEYSWDTRLMSWTKAVSRYVVEAKIMDMIMKQACACRLSVYAAFSGEYNIQVLIPHELHNRLVYIIPHFVHQFTL